MINFECKLCGHVYGTEWPSQPVVQLHLTVSHDVPDGARIYAI